MAEKKKASTGPTTSVRSCTCVSRFQDREYGHGMRLHNRRVKTPGWRCTVCGREVTTSAA